MNGLRRRWREALEKHNVNARTFESSSGLADVTIVRGLIEIAAASEDTLEEAMEECLVQLDRKEWR